MRDKKRYVMLRFTISLKQLMNSTDIDMKLLSRMVNRELIFKIGELHYADSNPKAAAILDDRTIIYKTLLKGHDDFIEGLSIIKRINGIDLGIYTIKESGTIKTLKDFYKENKDKINSI